ncbi:MAG: acyl-CoA dehydrogenase family protein [Anaerolineales bacterium]|uniref:Acyl-CoA dehydrogenase family protein n=1 Tax=Candidatus Desulfolinea nitratireducens TaxID=2841698 RepID=A0A8J6NMI2_9CHLR|nr:acyl-CoA dehydrogenase family protein [Candidatus Desulfolinea nitratireducens]MBL6960075.1 acyl-CoA dehydrogenase family protein [Anaerolineales bacterium]
MSNAEKIIEAARYHSEEIICPNVDQWESSLDYPIDAAKEAAKNGLLGLYCPKEFGGQGLSFAEGIPVFEELGRGEGLYAFSFSMHNIVTFAICSFGQEKLRDHWAPKLTSGKALGGFVLTEPQSGSDAARVRTHAVVNKNGSYTINGSKAWVSLADVADIFLVVVKTSEKPGKDDIAMVAVPKDTPGLSFGKPYDKLVSSFLPIADMFLENVTVPAENVIFPPGKGLSGSLMAIDIARTSIAAGCCGLISSSLDLALTFARDRKMFGRSELEFQGIQWMLADVATDLEASRLLYKNAARLIGTPEGTVAAAHAKRFTPDAAQRAIATCMQVLGGTGLLTPSAIERNYRIAPVMKMVDGTTEIQRVVISRSLQKYAETLPTKEEQECN